MDKERKIKRKYETRNRRGGTVTLCNWEWIKHRMDWSTIAGIPHRDRTVQFTDKF